MFISLFDEKFIEGFTKGKTEGFVQGEVRGKLEGRIETIFLFLSARFNGVTKRLEKKIQKIDDMEKLDELTKLAAKCESLKEFEKNMPQPTAKKN